jgi:hypothetical protein
MFDPAQLTAEVNRVLAQQSSALKPGATSAILIAADTKHAQVVYAHRIGNAWELDGDLSTLYHGGGLEAGVTLHGSW